MSTRLLIISGCTRDKAVHHANDLRVPDFADPARFQKAEAALAQLRTPATSMYLGQEHMRLTATLAVLRERLGANAVEHRIMSAGYGLLTEHQLVVPYDATFDTMTEPEADDWAEFLGIPASVREAVRGRRLWRLCSIRPTGEPFGCRWNRRPASATCGFRPTTTRCLRSPRRSSPPR